MLGQGFRRAYPIQDHHEFDELLRRIDDVDLLREKADRD